MRANRNDPCPCGSGKKYKKCCLAVDESRRTVSPPPDVESEPRESQRQSAFGALFRFAARREFDERRTVAFAVFHGPQEPLAEDLAEDEQLKFLFHFVFDAPQKGGRTIAERFLDEAATFLTERQQRLLRRTAAARLRPYEVEDVEVDRGVRLRDLWSGQSLYVTERAGTRQMTRWDLLGARLVREEDGTTRFEGGIYLLPVRLKAPLLEAIRAAERRLRRRNAGLDEQGLFRHCAPLFHRLWLDQVVFPPPPVTVTAEGDPIEFGTIVYDVLDAAALRAALDGHPSLDADEEEGGYTWFEAADDADRPQPSAGGDRTFRLANTSPDGFHRTLGRIAVNEGRLTLEVVSRARAERGRRLLAEAAGGVLKHRSTRFESAEKALARERSRRRDDTLAPRESIPPDVAAEFLREFKERHYRAWLDEPLPALDGRTPRHAASLKTQRGRVIDLLKELENYESRRGADEGGGYDFSWMWRELGLER